MASNNRPSSHSSNGYQSTQHSPMPSSHTPGHEMRIQIEDNEMQLPTNLRPVSASEFYSIRNATGAVQQNISSILNQARNEIERRTSQTRMWGLQIDAMLQGVQRPPLIPHPLAAIPNNDINRTEAVSTRILPPDPTNRIHILHGNANHSNSNLEGVTVRISLNSDENAAPPTTISAGTSSSTSSISNSASRAETSTSSGGNSSPLRSRSEHPFLDRVAALTRDDPPDLVGRPGRPDLDGVLAEMLAPYPLFRRFIKAATRYIPFILFLLVKSVFDHFEAVTDVVTLFSIFYFMDSSLQKQVARQAQSKKWICLRDIGIMMLCLLYWIKERKDYYNLLLIKNVKWTISFSTLFYSVCITDGILKIITVLIKNVIAALPSRILPYSRRGRFYILIESASQLYRYLAPVELWVVYLTARHSVAVQILCGMTYFFLKSIFLLHHLEFLKNAIVMFPRKVKYGSIPTKEDIEKTGDQCAICHDTYTTPVLLKCNHIFCENCIGSWFRTETTCPMCRAKVAEDMSWLDGQTTQFIQIF